ncbi:hypothetical protein E2C01_081197 [Portunus trituberculatus]|uniref:Secreted protein n=1 Tax=Portunus trituberculatus TaxID=210409 RepID=A0A5B7IVM4_PORTR|nr:hypothetical protein [Portunus trituberculatus]
MVKLVAVVWVIELHMTCPAIEEEGTGVRIIGEAGWEGILTLCVHREALDDALSLKVSCRDDRQGCGGKQGEIRTLMLRHYRSKI